MGNYAIGLSNKTLYHAVVPSNGCLDLNSPIVKHVQAVNILSLDAPVGANCDIHSNELSRGAAIPIALHVRGIIATSPHSLHLLAQKPSLTTWSSLRL